MSRYGIYSVPLASAHFAAVWSCDRDSRVAAPALAATPAEAYVQQNVQKGLTILNNHSISDSQRRSQFRDFLTGLTDIRRIAVFTLGPRVELRLRRTSKLS